MLGWVLHDVLWMLERPLSKLRHTRAALVLSFVLVLSQVGVSFWHEGRISLLASTMDSSPGGAILCASVYQHFLFLDLDKAL